MTTAHVDATPRYPLRSTHDAGFDHLRYVVVRSLAETRQSHVTVRQLGLVALGVKPASVAGFVAEPDGSLWTGFGGNRWDPRPFLRVLEEVGLVVLEFPSYDSDIEHAVVVASTVARAQGSNDCWRRSSHSHVEASVTQPRFGMGLCSGAIALPARRTWVVRRALRVVTSLRSSARMPGSLTARTQQMDQATAMGLPGSAAVQRLGDSARPRMSTRSGALVDISCHRSA